MTKQANNHASTKKHFPDGDQGALNENIKGSSSGNTPVREGDDAHEMPLVSILVPVYNVETYLAECLESLCAQTYPHLQIICIDDGSTDSSPAILRDYAQRDSRIEIITKPNSGYGDSMNKGLEAARGKYVGIVESDDFIDAGMYEAYVEMAERFDVDLVKSNYYQFWNDRATYFNENTKGACDGEAESAPTSEQGEVSSPRALSAPERVLDTEVDEKIDLFEASGLPINTCIRPRDYKASFILGPTIWSALYKRSFLLENGITFATTPGAAFQDASFSHMVLICAERAVYLPDAWLHYRVDSAGSSSNSPDKVFLVFGEFDRSLDFLKAYAQRSCGEYERNNDACDQASQEAHELGRENVLTVTGLQSAAAALGAARMASYMWSYNRIAPRFKLQYALRWRRDLLELNHEGLIDYALLRRDSRDLLMLLAEDPLGFVQRCAHYADWFYYHYQPYEEWQPDAPRLAFQDFIKWSNRRSAAAKATPHLTHMALKYASERAYAKTRHGVGSVLRKMHLLPSCDHDDDASEQQSADGRARAPERISARIATCLPVGHEVVWRFTITIPDAQAPFDLSIFDGSGQPLGIEPILFEDQSIDMTPDAIECGSSSDADHACDGVLPEIAPELEESSHFAYRCVTYSLRIPTVIGSFGLTAQQGDAQNVTNLYVSEQRWSEEVKGIEPYRLNAWDQPSYVAWLRAHELPLVIDADAPGEADASVLPEEYVAVVGDGIVLEPMAYQEITKVLEASPHAAAVYTDHDSLDAEGRRIRPFFKPEFSPDLLRSYNYVGNFVVIRRDLSKKAKEKSPAGLMLCAAESGDAIVHVPQILFHETETHIGFGTTNEMSAAQEVIANSWSSDANTMHDSPANTLDVDAFHGATVDIIIPSKDHAEVLESCITSILDGATHQDYLITIVENGSKDLETFALYERLQDRDSRVRVITYEDESADPQHASREFNYSRLINYGVAHTNNPFILLLNNDTRVITPDFLQVMLQPLQREEVGVVGAKLLFRDGLVQHVGMLIGPDGTVVHATQDVDDNWPGYMYRNIVSSNVSAVTGACQMMRRETFEQVDGYSEEFAVGFNDADFCCKVRAQGLFITMQPQAQLYHFEFTSRGREVNDPAKLERWSRERNLFQDKWPRYFKEGDPFSNPNLDPNSKCFGLPKQKRVL